MGEVYLEVLQRQCRDRFGMEVAFADQGVVYRETIENAVEGVGHYEPLRHYAEVHLMLSPGERGSGVTVSTALSTDDLAMNWQRLILTHLREKQHLGVLTGSPITDVKITLVNGRAHLKHTEGGDFRQATYRAVRQGLMKAKSVLLEPYLSLELTLPEETLGRAMSDIREKLILYKTDDHQNYNERCAHDTADDKVLFDPLLAGIEAFEMDLESCEYREKNGENDKISFHYPGKDICI